MVKAMINAAEGEDRDAPIEGLAGALTAYTEDFAEGVAAFAPSARQPSAVDRIASVNALTRIAVDTYKLNAAMHAFRAIAR